jgi:hypothetical protein
MNEGTGKTKTSKDIRVTKGLFSIPGSLAKQGNEERPPIAHGAKTSQNAFMLNSPAKFKISLDFSKRIAEDICMRPVSYIMIQTGDYIKVRDEAATV